MPRCMPSPKISFNPSFTKNQAPVRRGPIQARIDFHVFFKPPIRPQRRQFIGAIRSRRLIFSNCCESGLKAMVSIHVHGLFSSFHGDYTRFYRNNYSNERQNRFDLNRFKRLS